MQGKQNDQSNILHSFLFFVKLTYKCLGAGYCIFTNLGASLIENVMDAFDPAYVDR